MSAERVGSDSADRDSPHRVDSSSAHRRKVEVIQDLQWEESIAAVKMAPSFTYFESYRDAIVDQAFMQSSRKTRWRYANSNFLRSFLPNGSLSDPVIVAWKAFRDEAALRHVMRWQYVSSNLLVAGLVDGPLATAVPGEPVDELIDNYFIHAHNGLNPKGRNRLRTNLRKLGLLVEHKKVYYRIVPDVSPRAVAVLLAHLFAPEPQVVAWSTLAADPWWKLLGIVDEDMLRSKLVETAEAALIARIIRMDTLEQLTTRYSLAQFEAGKVRAR